MAGWIWEILYVSAHEKHWVNRGFLYGPWLPIYGSGAVAILWTTLPVQDTVPLAFLIGAVSATLLELATGAAMEHIFHMRYWDYSNKPMNWKGYICLPVSLGWGIFTLFLLYVLHPPAEHLVLAIPEGPAQHITLILTILFVVDTTKSTQDALGMKTLMAKLTQLAHEHLQGQNLPEWPPHPDHFREAFQRFHETLEYRKHHRYRRAISILRRNPSAVSRRYREAFAELNRLKNTYHSPLHRKKNP